MKKSKSDLFFSLSFLVVIATLMCLLLHPLSLILKPGKEVNKEFKTFGDSKDTHKTFVKNGAIEAVVPFLHADLLSSLYHYKIKLHVIVAIKILISQSPYYIDKYLKTLLLFILAPNAP